MAFHTKAPSEVKMANWATFMRDMPAGIEMSWRMAGMRRPMKVDTAP